MKFILQFELKITIGNKFSLNFTAIKFYLTKLFYTSMVIDLKT